PDVASDGAPECLREGQQADPPLPGKPSRLALPEIRNDGSEVRLRLRAGDPRLQPSQQMHATHAFDDTATLERNWQVDICATPHEPLWHDADDRTNVVVQLEPPAEHTRIA